jgi:chloramphenicol-sensitive protein RarD
MSSTHGSDQQAKGIAAGVAAYLVWGLVPFFWKQLAAVPAWELILHRVTWSLALCAALLSWTRGWTGFREAFTSGRSIGLNLLSSVLLSINWTIYVWGVNAGHVVECSLGYYLTPLLSVLLGRWLLGERLTRLQLCAVGLAAVGVGIIVLASGRPPWIALGIALSWGFYGLCRKKSPLGAVQSLAVETALLAPIAIIGLLWLAITGRGAIGHVSGMEHFFVFSTGIVTAVPLIWFAYAVRRTRLSMLGLIQFIVPSLQLVIGVVSYGEPLDQGRFVAFALIWIGVALFITDTVRRMR